MTDLWPLNGAGAVPTCPDCAEGREHRFLVKLAPAEGPCWEVAVTSIGPKGAKGVAVQKAIDGGDWDAVAVSAVHA